MKRLPLFVLLNQHLDEVSRHDTSDGKGRVQKV